MHEEKIAVIGATFSGNKGASAMLESLISNTTHLSKFPVHFDVLSIYPERDKLWNIQDNVSIVPLNLINLIFILPLTSLLYSLLGKLHLPRNFLLKHKPLETIVNARALLDVSGISYVDKRETTLVYNIACNLPAILVGTPVIKMSQAIGPIKRKFNILLSRPILKRIKIIFARGRETELYLEELGLKNFRPSSDLAFILNNYIPLPDLEGKYKELKDKDVIIGICPSEVLNRYSKKSGINLISILATYAERMQKEIGAHIVIIAHSYLGDKNRST